MSKERIEGAAQKGVGEVKRAIGKVIGDPTLQAEGAADVVLGAAKETFGKVKDAVHKKI
ncbi:MAG: CsbD family protein [Caulobacteraceae bacterium]